jgi:hypothetical protein
VLAGTTTVREALSALWPAARAKHRSQKRQSCLLGSLYKATRA